MRPAFWAIGVGALLVSTSAAESLPQRHEFTQTHMGVAVRIVLYAPDDQTANKAATAAFARIQQLDRMMTDYDPESELRRLCRASGPGKPVRVSPELLCVLCRSLELSRRSHGALDVTVGPMVRLWRRARRRKELPDEERLAQARELVGFERVYLQPCDRTVELLKWGMKLDLGAVAKGYICGEASRVLRDQGITRTLVEAGGDITVGDPPPDRPAWRIEIGRPPFLDRTGAADQSDHPVLPVLFLQNTAVATSGDTYQFVEIGGVRYSHLVDPRTGMALTRPSTVTVVAADGLTADGLASAVNVLGPTEGLKLIEETEGAAAFIIQQQDGGRARTYASRRVPNNDCRATPRLSQ